MKDLITIKVISKACGIHPQTLRAWETRYGLFEPGRNEKGQRIYTQQDVAKAKLLAQLVSGGFTISTLAGQSFDQLKSLVSDKSLQNIKARPYSPNIENLLNHLKSYQIQDVVNEIQHLRISSSVEQFIFEIILPVMREIGTYVAAGKYTVTQEHIISTIVRDQLSQLYLPNLGGKLNQMALATPEGNLHELSILIADILCRNHRFTTRYLGAAHPAHCLAEAMNALKTPFLVLGALTSDQWNYEKSIAKYLTKIDKLIDYELEVILGGGYEIALPKFKNITKVRFMTSFEDFNDLLSEVI